MHSKITSSLSASTAPMFLSMSLLIILSFFVLIRFLNAVFSLIERFCKLFSFFKDSMTEFIVLCIFQLSASISFIDSRFNLREINYVLHSSKKIFEKINVLLPYSNFHLRMNFVRNDKLKV